MSQAATEPVVVAPKESAGGRGGRGARGGRGGRGGNRGGGNRGSAPAADTTNASLTNNNNTNTNEKNNNGPKQGSASTDPAFLAQVTKENAQLEEISKKQAAFKDQVGKIKEQIAAKDKVIKSLIPKRDAAHASLKATKDEKNKLKEKKEAIKAKLTAFKADLAKKGDEIKSARQKLPISKLPEDKAGEKGTSRDRELIKLNESHFDAQIAALERKLNTTSRSLKEEKQFMNELSALKAQKRSVLKEFTEKIETLSFDNPEIKKSKEAAQELEVQIKELYTKEKAEHDAWQVLQKELDQHFEELKKLRTEKTQLSAKQDELSAQYKKVQEVIKKKKTDFIKHQKEQREKLKEQREKAREEREKLRKQKEEERKKKQEEREARLAAMLPYESELDVCEALITYLESIKPKEDPKAKKSNRQKKHTEVLRHPEDIISYYEELSLKTPLTPLDIESSIKEVNGKTEHYKTLQAEELKKRAAAKEAAEKAKLEEEAQKAAEAASEPAVQTETKAEAEKAAEEKPAETPVEEKKEEAAKEEEAKEAAPEPAVVEEKKEEVAAEPAAEEKKEEAEATPSE